MIQAKHALLQALAAAMNEIVPEAQLPAAFEAPKQAAHGDLPARWPCSWPSL
jgi:arginyl-tRNA synthetase